jgi:hypothetical protein
LEGTVGLQTQIVKRLHVLLETGSQGISPSTTSVLGVYQDLRFPMATFPRYRGLLRNNQDSLTLLVQQPEYEELWQDCLTEGMALRQGDPDLKTWSRPLPRTLLGWLEEALARADVLVPSLDKLLRILKEPSMQQYAKHTIEQVGDDGREREGEEGREGEGGVWVWVVCLF